MSGNATRAALRGPCASALGRALTESELNLADKYLELLIKWQKSQRLVASSDASWIAERLFADSLLFLKVLPLSARRFVDIGSGAGFPGIPIKIVNPGLEMLLIEARQRRASFLRAVVRELGLLGVEVCDQRLEVVAPAMADRFDAATMRCAGDPRSLVSSALLLVRARGIVIASGPPPAGTPSGRRGGGRARRTGDREPRGLPIRAGEDAAELRQVSVPGVDGRTRTFLVAQKS